MGCSPAAWRRMDLETWNKDKAQKLINYLQQSVGILSNS